MFVISRSRLESNAKGSHQMSSEGDKKPPVKVKQPDPDLRITRTVFARKKVATKKAAAKKAAFKRP